MKISEVGDLRGYIKNFLCLDYLANDHPRASRQTETLALRPQDKGSWSLHETKKDGGQLAIEAVVRLTKLSFILTINR